MTGPLGRRVPTDWRHVEKYPLTAETTPAPPTPVVLGVGWYSNFDTPVQKGREWWIGEGSLGTLRGGHAIAVKPSALTDPLTWWDFYDQGTEGACVGFASSRMMSLLNRNRYAARWLYLESQKVDEWEGENYSGTSVRAAMSILQARGHRKVYRGAERPEDAAEGLSAYRWAQSVDEVRAVLSSPGHDRRQAVPLLNSWGRSWPHIVYLPYTTLERLIQEDGEVALVTDR